MIELIYIDLFCGGGGTTTGVHSARLDNQPCAIVAACINHDTNAIRSHKSNHKQTLHFTEDITMLYNTSRMARLVQHVNYIKNLYPTAKVILWASLECTNFSKAKGGQPRDADSRTLANHLFPYIEALNPYAIQIENVEEFMSWGPLSEDGKPLSKNSGEDYVKWINSVKKYGYKFEYRILNAADYGAYTSRRRYFGQFCPLGKEIYWPEQTHAEKPEKTLFGNSLQKWKAVKDVLDFTDEGESMFDRKKPLVDATWERTYAGLIKFVAGGKKAFLIKYNSMSRKGKYTPPSIDNPCPVVSTQNRLGIINANFLSAYYGTGDNVSSIDKPSPVVTTKDRLSIVQPKFMISYNFRDTSKDINSPCPTILTKDRLSLIQTRFIDQQYGNGKPASIHKPIGTLTANPKYSPVCVDRFIMNQYSGGGQTSDIAKPAPAILATPKQNLITTKWIANTHFNNVGASVNSPAQTITANRKWHYLMNPQFKSKGGSVDRPCFTLIARMDKQPPYLIEASSEFGKTTSFVKISDNKIIYEIYDTDSKIVREVKEFMAMYGIIDIKMRMLRIPELKKIMGFPEDYILLGTQADQKKFIGNAVEVRMATAIVQATAEGLQRENIRIAS